MDNIALWIGVSFALVNFVFAASLILSSTMAGVAITKVSYGMIKFMQRKIKGISIEFGALPISSSVDLAGVVDLEENPNPEWKPTDFRAKSTITQLLIILSSPIVMIVLGVGLSWAGGLSMEILGIALEMVFLTLLFVEGVTNLTMFFELYLTAATNPFLVLVGILLLVQGILGLANLQMVYNGRLKVSLSIILMLILMTIVLGFLIRLVLAGFILDCLYILLGALLVGIVPYLLILFLVANLPIVTNNFEDIIDDDLSMEE